MIRFILVTLLAAILTQSPIYAFGDGKTCESPCEKACKTKADDCKKDVKRSCKAVGRYTPYKIVCKVHEKNCERAGTYCKHVGCMDQPPKDCGGGSTSGEPHIVTFDRKYYDFQGVGEFVLARSESRDIDIQIRTAAFGSRLSVNSAIAIRQGDERITIDASRDEVVWTNGEPTPVEIFTSDRLDISNENKVLRTEDNRYIILLRDGTRLSIYARKPMGVHIRPSLGEQDFVGMLGDYNRNPLNDLKTRYGELIDLVSLRGDARREALYISFGNSWRVTMEESLFDYPAGMTTADFTDFSHPALPTTGQPEYAMSREEAEAACRKEGLVEGIAFDICVFDMMMTGDPVFAESARHLAKTTPAVAIRATSPRRLYEAEPEPVPTTQQADTDIQALDPAVLMTTPNIAFTFERKISAGTPINIKWDDADTTRNYIVEIVEAGDTTYNSMSYGGRWTQASRAGYDTREWTAKPISEPGLYAVRYVDRGSRSILHLETFEVIGATEE